MTATRGVTRFQDCDDVPAGNGVWTRTGAGLAWEPRANFANQADLAAHAALQADAAHGGLLDQYFEERRQAPLEAIPSMFVNGSLTPTAGTYYLMRVRARTAALIAGGAAVCSTTFLNATDMRLALLSDDRNTVLGVTGNLGNPATGTAISGLFGAAVQLVQWTYYWLAFAVVGNTAGAVAGVQPSRINMFQSFPQSIVYARTSLGYAGGAIPAGIGGTISSSNIPALLGYS